jgi:hypothetical protein
MAARYGIVLFTLALASSASAGKPKTKPVEVVNFPAVQAVNVVSGCGEALQLLGFTSASVAATGPLALTAACEAEFPESRICTSEEVIKTRSVPQSLSGRAWVLPAFQPIDSALVDASGLFGGVGSFNCQSWQALGGTALTMDGNGAFFPNVCSEPRPVACCGVPQ